MCANLAAKDAKIGELRGVLSSTALRLESETTKLSGRVEMDRIPIMKRGGSSPNSMLSTIGAWRRCKTCTSADYLRNNT